MNICSPGCTKDKLQGQVRASDWEGGGRGRREEDGGRAGQLRDGERRAEEGPEDGGGYPGRDQGQEEAETRPGACGRVKLHPVHNGEPSGTQARQHESSVCLIFP